jgi:hypothetical protein
MQRRLTTMLGTLLAGLTVPAMALPLDSLILDVDAGPLAFIQNDGRYGTTGTPFNAGTVRQSDNLYVAPRISAEAAFGGRHTLLFLHAPFDVSTRATLGNPLTFRDTTFPAGSVVDSRYLFEGFRLSYLYRLGDWGPFGADVGGTLQIRNANVALTDAAGTRHAAETDIGLVPALKARLRYRPAEGPWAMLEADGLSTFGLSRAGGGLLDAVLTLGVPVRPGLDAVVRARYLGGGADVPNRNFYNWAQFIAFTGGLRWDVTQLPATLGLTPPADKATTSEGVTGKPQAERTKGKPAPAGDAGPASPAAPAP